MQSNVKIKYCGELGKIKRECAPSKMTGLMSISYQWITEEYYKSTNEDAINTFLINQAN